MKAVEIFSIGDELLRGIVQDSNSHWMAKRIAARGAALVRIATLPDRPDVVAGDLRAAIDRRPALILTQGGLGPTDDDRTREAIALATGRRLTPHPEAEAIVRRRYGELAAAGRVADVTLSDARLRMSLLPEGASALDNQVGAAPAVVLNESGSTIVALPGVPPELQWIWEHPLRPLLDRVLGPGGFGEVTLTLDLRDESAIADMLRGVAARHPFVYVKSRAAGFEEGEEVRVTLTAPGADDEAARGLVDSALEDLRASLAGMHIRLIG